MSLLLQIDLYCERTDFGLWSEPVNALTNIEFILAGVLLMSRPRRPGTVPSVAMLPPLIVLIGIASFTFHTLATAWAGWTDTLSILLFACVFVYAFFSDIGRAPAWLSLAAAGAFFAASFAAKLWLPDLGLNGSEAYLPMVLGLAAMIVYLAREPSTRKQFATATGLLLVSLTLRTIDADVCAAFPLGTHFAWHLLNAAVLYLLSAALMQRRAPGTASA